MFSDPPAPLAQIAVRLLPERGTRTPACVTQAKRGARRRERRGRELAVHRWRGEPKGSLRRRAILQSAATIFVMKFCRDLRRRIPSGPGYFVEPPLMEGAAPTVPLECFPIAVTQLGRLAGRSCEAAKAGGEELCYFANVKVGGSTPPGRESVAQRESITTPRKRQYRLDCSPALYSFARSVVKIAVTSFFTREAAGSNPVGCSMHP